MREVDVSVLTQIISTLFQDACHKLPDDVVAALRNAREREESPYSRDILEKLLENAELGPREMIPVCQDTGLAVIFIELGQDVHLVGGDLRDAVNEGVRRGYRDGYLRKSTVRQPYTARVNTGDNTPCDMWVEIVPGEKVKISVLPKGGGSENMARLTVLTPAMGRKGIIDFVTSVVDEAGGNPCPPLVVGVGIGGTTEKTMMLAKKSLLRPVGEPAADAEDAALERDLLKRINDLGVGSLGYGGTVTALAVHVDSFPCHIASLPVAVNLQCHSARRGTATI
ncbi:MAG: fumarate hydratase [Dehalococcoidia bacterium]|nr:MAG: fumarate hydratase [Dehalococcoidia bacterium]